MKLYVRAIKGKCPCRSVQQCYSVGEYLSGNWRTVEHVCEECVPHLQKRIKECGREVVLVGYRGCKIPSFLIKDLSNETKI